MKKNKCKKSSSGLESVSWHRSGIRSWSRSRSRSGFAIRSWSTSGSWSSYWVNSGSSSE